MMLDQATQRRELAAALEQLIAELQELGWWDLAMPSAAALASQQPFAADSMEFAEWLRWVFVVRLQALLDSPESSLPTRCSIEPMAEHCYQHQLDKVRGLLNVLKRIDQILTQA